MSSITTNSEEEDSASLPSSPSVDESSISPSSCKDTEGPPKPYGKVHPTLQRVDCPVDGIDSLREYLGEDDPIGNWQPPPEQHPSRNSSTSTSKSKMSIQITNVATWFPNDDHVAFYSPISTTSGQKYEAMSYRDLQQQLSNCPSFSSHSFTKANKRVALVIPAEEMTETAVALLSIMARGMVAVPLDPRMPTSRILDAMEQLECTTLVTTEPFLVEHQLLELVNNNNHGQPVPPQVEPDTNDGDENRVYCYRTHPSVTSSLDGLAYFDKVTEIRLVSNNKSNDTSKKKERGYLDWTCLSRVPNNHNTTKEEWWTPSKHANHDDPSMLSVASASNQDDPVLLLRTSGTTNTPKIVPITYNMLLYGALSIAAAHGLKRHDCNCNALPFYHTGGISCNLLAVLVSGGSVLMAGPFQDPNDYLDHLLLDKRPNASHNTNSNNNANLNNSMGPAPTWYYAGPSMHKAIILMAEARFNKNNKKPLPSRLRFIRNAQAHINHSLVLRLSTVFGCAVVPTYGMSEAMPISSSVAIDVRFQPPCEVVDSVGYCLTNVCILDSETGQVMEYGSDNHDNPDTIIGDVSVEAGEIAVKGAGVIAAYLGMDVTKTHDNGWLRTGDLGIIDKQGRLFIKGRSKEMIKRGGEQVWPNEIEDVVEKVPGVFAACCFGVPNELWGEEVAVAVVLADATQKDNQPYLNHLSTEIMKACKERLDDISMPQQIKYLSSTKELLCSSSGKYIKSKMAQHLGVTAVDTGALRVLTSASQLQEAANAVEQEESLDDTEKSLWDKCLALLETTSEDGHRVIPSDALNGVRFLVTLFVCQVHVGLFPNLPWVKLQGYFPNMMIFFSIGGLQTTLQVARSVKNEWANFVGTRIGALHSLYVISQFITYPSYVLFRAFDEDGNLIWDTSDWIKSVLWFIFCTVTAMGHKWNINMFAWFQSTYYLFLALFPFMDDKLRHLTLKWQLVWLVAMCALAGALWGIVVITVPPKFFWKDLYPLGWTIVTWLPLLVASMIAAYLFRRIVEFCAKKKVKDLALAADSESQEQSSDDPSSINAEYVVNYTKPFGMICDATSILLLIIWITVAFVPNCLCVYEETLEAMRPGELPQEPGCKFRPGLDDYYWTCDITYDEFIGYIYTDPHHFEYGRFATNFAAAVGYLRCIAPLFLLWCTTMAFGTGYTSRLFGTRLFRQYLAPLGYPVYLIHMSVARYYWVATRGLKRQFWWGREGEFPFPVQWWEFFVIVGISIVLGAFVNNFLVPPLLPHTISFGVTCTTWISKWCKWCTQKCCRRRLESLERSNSCETNDFHNNKHDERATSHSSNSSAETPTIKQVKTMIRGLTGMEAVSRDLPLKHLGLDSLGATALLGTLRCTVPAARNLTLRQLQGCETVGSLYNLLDGKTTSRASSDSEQTVASPMSDTEMNGRTYNEH